MKKTIYFIRHGESETNATGVSMGPDSGLTEKGRQQARFVGERFTRLPVDGILTSTYKRALQTTECIKEFIDKEVEESNLLVERKSPSENLGKTPDDPETIRIDNEIRQGRLKDSHYRYSDEESFEDLKERAQKVVMLLEGYKVDNILVVTHGFFLRYIITHMIFGRDLTISEFEKFSVFVKTRNTGITVCEFDSRQHESIRGWSMIAWNDHAHLNELLKEA